MRVARPTSDTEMGERSLDVEVAIRLERYRWVRWAPDTSPELSVDDQGGRFLGPPGHLLSHLWVPAPADCPLASQPLRYLPSYSRDVSLAFRACESCGLFRDGAARLTRADDGSWRIVVHAPPMDLRDEMLPRLLCRAGLTWSRTRSLHALRP